MDEYWALHHPTLETVLAAHDEKTAIVRQNGSVYIDIELLCSLIDQTIEVNVNANRDNLDEVAPYIQGLATGTKWAADLFTYLSFTDELEMME